ncbi:MAG: fibronectin type III domain-containing protein, partial [Bacteroidales bacterium]|nr:fibronectin type III domain-containing protein [Bacteroidales bacterium]
MKTLLTNSHRLTLVLLAFYCFTFMGQKTAFAQECIINLSDLPYSNDFNDFAIGPYGSDCFIFSAGGPPTIMVQPIGYEGSLGIRFYSAGYVVLPKLAADIDITTLKLSFKYSPNSVSGAGTNPTFQIGVTTDSTNSNASAYQPVESFNYNASTSSWFEDQVTFEDYTGEGRFIVIKSLQTGTTIFFDDLYLEQNISCVPPSHVTSSNVTGSSAMLSWQPGSPSITGYNVYYSTDSSNWQMEIITANSTANSCLLSGLAPTTSYYVNIEAICNESESDEVFSFRFNTKCDNYAGEAIEGVSGETTNGTHLPISTYYPRSYAQQIFLANELSNTPQQITALAFQYDGTASQNRNLIIHLSHIPDTAFASAAHWFTVNDSDLVFTGSQTFVNETAGDWVIIPFDSAFNHNGIDNILVTVEDRTGNGLQTAQMTFNTHQTIGSRSAYAGTYQSLTDWGHIAPEDYSTYRSNIKFMTCGEFECLPPASIIVENITNNSATLRFANATGSTGSLYRYKQSTDSEWFDWQSVTTNSITLTSLEQSTAYQFQVVTLCGENGDTSAIATTSFSTICGYMSLPYVEDFDGYNQGETPNCWTIPNIGSTSTVTVTRTTANSAFFMGGTETGYKYAILPQLGDNINPALLEINFRANFSAAIAGQYLLVGILASPTNTSSFEIVDTLHAQTAETWTNHSVSFEDYEGNGTCIALRWTNGGTTTLLIDDLSVDWHSSCPRNTNLTVSDIATTSATLSWDGDASVSQWVVEYGNAHFTPGNGSFSNAGNSEFELTDLEPNTLYDAYVYSVCRSGSDTSIISNVIRFRTAQNMTGLPYNCDFENDVENGNWTLVNDFSSNQWVVGTATNNTVAGANALYISNDEGINNAMNMSYGHSYVVWAYRDIYFDEASPNYNLSFDWKSAGGNFAWFSAFIGEPNEIAAAYSNTNYYNVSDFHNAPANTESILSQANSSNGWETISHTLPSSYHNTTQRLYFVWYHSGTSTNPPAAIDNIVVTALQCEIPTELTISNISTDSLNLSWTEIEDIPEYLVEYGVLGFTTGTGVVLSSEENQITITGLLPNINYQFYVRSVCDNGDTSAYSAATSALTTQAPASLPYYCDFEDNGENRNWGFRNSNQTNQWFIGSGANNTVSGSRALYISDDHGVSNNYTGSSASWAYRDIHFSDLTENGEYILSLDWRCLGETRNDNPSDYFSVLLGEATTPIDGNPNLLGVSSTRLAQLNGSSDWQNKRFFFPATYSDTTLRLYFLWYSDGTVNNQPPVAIDNISLEMSPCVAPTTVTVIEVTDAHIGLIWNSSASQWIVEY